MFTMACPRISETTFHQAEQPARYRYLHEFKNDMVEFLRSLRLNENLNRAHRDIFRKQINLIGTTVVELTTDLMGSIQSSDRMSYFRSLTTDPANRNDRLEENEVVIAALQGDGSGLHPDRWPSPIASVHSTERSDHDSDDESDDDDESDAAPAAGSSCRRAVSNETISVRLT